MLPLLFLLKHKKKHIVFFIHKFHTLLMGLELTASPSTLLLQGKEMAFETELIGQTDKKTCYS